MTGKVTIIVGLPGSGKSHLIRKLRKRATGECVEDFMAFSYDDSRRFTDSKHYPKLIRDLRKGRHSIIADIFFCDTALRERIGKSIHFQQVADLRSRHCNRTLGMTESCRKVAYRPQITVFNLAEEYERTS